MAAIFQSHHLSSPKLFLPSPIPLCNSDTRTHTLLFATSSNKPPSSSRRRKVKSNHELCNDIRDFLSSVGLPHHHVPSTKELSHHGRQDLANLVRRRGYKLIGQLLQTPPTEKMDTFQTEKLEVLIPSEGQEEGSKLVSDVFQIEPAQEKDIHGVKGNYGEVNPSSDSPVTSESTILSLEEKVAKFIQGGELDAVEDDDLGVMYDKYTEQAKRIIKSVDDLTSGSSHEKPEELSLHGSSETVLLNGNASSSALKINDSESGRYRYISTEESTTNDSKRDSDIKNMEIQDETKRLKFMLQQKELELIELKEQIEKEKLALSVLQATAETEISKARLLVSEKETELHVAEESLCGLKEVEIQYSAEGETVELAGSFNGWHHKIKMDAESASTEPSRSRTSRLWRAVLWLYPGTYEIKFVVDGHWTIDPHRELTNQGGLHNNILRVDR